MKNKKIAIIIGAIIMLAPIIFIIVIIVMISSAMSVIGGGSTLDDGIFQGLPFLADYYTCTSDYGDRENPTGQGIKKHNGIDLVAFRNDGTKDVPIVTVFDGIVTFVTLDEQGASAGNSIEIYNEEKDMYIQYMHMAVKPRFDVGDEVVAGDELGIQGTTGNSTGIHLHFQVKLEEGRRLLVNPREFFDFAQEGEWRKIENIESTENVKEKEE